MKKRLAIFGGTFSPPHIGHVRAAEAFVEAVKPEKLLILPSAIPPHKAPVLGAGPDDRLAMCRLAFSHIPVAEVSDMEIRRTGKSYTVLTLSELASPEWELTMLVGTDMFLTLDTWYRAEEIFKLTEIAVIRRESDRENEAPILEKSEEYRRRYGARIRFIPAPATVLSSSEVRERLRAGANGGNALLPAVEDYVKQWHLYQE
ncbi:MAG: nicotinate (nicotinamide) nucleotide adenylyltransferase [Clostridia bacterium]|nr:nicotinate (nicotinamide) nucleotide adenylyltransferase [Clostridia bacterium]